VGRIKRISLFVIYSPSPNSHLEPRLGASFTRGMIEGTQEEDAKLGHEDYVLYYCGKAFLVSSLDQEESIL